jgi:hypothetical protein
MATSSTDRPTPAPVRDPKFIHRFRLFILITGTLVTFAMVYGSGMRAQTRRVRDLDEQRKRIAQDLRQQQRVSRLRLAAVEQLEARRQVSLALLELDRRNFGTAQERVTEAVRLLDEAQKADSANPDLSAAADTLRRTTLAAAADVSGPREALLAVAAQMDAAFNGYTPRFIQDSVAEDAAHPIEKPTMNDVPNPNGAHSVMPGR